MKFFSLKIIKWFFSSFLLLSLIVLLNFWRESNNTVDFLSYYLERGVKLVGLSLVCSFFIVFLKNYGREIEK